MYVGTPYPPRLVGSRFHLYRISGRGVGALAVAACLAGAGAIAAEAAVAPSLSTAGGCYLVGQAVQLQGSGFAPSRTYVVTIDGVFLGQRTTDAAGNFSIAVHPGGLPAGKAQHVDRLEVSDGTSSAATTFTLTRSPGGRIFDTSGTNPNTISARFQVWGYSLAGSARTVYVHYVAPSQSARKTVSLGTTGGQCGALKTQPRRLFPLSVSKGTWTLQLDTRRSYSRHPRGPVTRISVRVSG
jgi:hypothetical protein